MKGKISKRFAVTLVAGVLAMVMAVGGTYAWFTATAQSGAGSNYKAAQVQLAFDNAAGKRFSIAKFALTSSEGVVLQRNLETGFYSNAPTFSDIAGGPSQAFPVKASQGDINSAVNQLLIPCIDSFATYFEVPDYDATSDYFTPGSLLYANTKIKNDSNVYTYLRLCIPKGANAANPKWIAAYGAVVLDSVSTESLKDALFYVPGNLSDVYDYVYYKYPLLPVDLQDQSAQDITVRLYSYVSGSANTDIMDAGVTQKELMNEQFYLSQIKAELIQASNNAIFLNPDWSRHFDFDGGNMPATFLEAPDFSLSP